MRKGKVERRCLEGFVGIETEEKMALKQIDLESMLKEVLAIHLEELEVGFAGFSNSN